ncbi:SDR family oxidoreductase [Paenibacillus sp. UNC451MF]|uniref:SDR family oxidoreductase n=1 Tax=Paenibacillus sp. UNC451MF TaxID=1449063 RepID=UPI00048B128B|nr:SDR family oxidoreductase [Paenibacillus sp. UNC451MF]
MTTQIALITGADRGVGLGLVSELLSQGFTVFAGRYASSEGHLQQLQSEYKDRLKLVDLDIADGDSVKAAASIVGQYTDHIDLLINNAGILGDIEATVMDELDYSEMQQVFNVNTLGTLRVTQAFLPMLLKSARKLLANISSEAGSVGSCTRINWYAYCMSKAALNMQSALIYNQFKAQGLKLLVLHPGYVQSYMHGELNTKASLTVEQAAANIVRVIDNYDSYESIDGKPPYIHTATGERLVW